MKDIRNKNKKSKLIFDPKVVRKLLKMNGDIKFCPYCGNNLTEKCECHKNIIIDVKPYRNADGAIEADRSVMVFLNNEEFQADLTQILDELSETKESEPEHEPEQITFDLD